MARVYRNKAYTGVCTPGTNKYIRKLRAKCVVSANYVPQEVKRKICEDIAIHNKDTIEYDAEGGNVMAEIIYCIIAIAAILTVYGNRH